MLFPGHTGTDYSIISHYFFPKDLILPTVLQEIGTNKFSFFDIPNSVPLSKE
jgi:hypothetical protein